MVVFHLWYDESLVSKKIVDKSSWSKLPSYTVEPQQTEWYCHWKTAAFIYKGNKLHVYILDRKLFHISKIKKKHNKWWEHQSIAHNNIGKWSFKDWPCIRQTSMNHPYQTHIKYESWSEHQYMMVKKPMNINKVV